MTQRLQRLLIRCLAGFGYLSVILQWFFVVIMYLSVAQHDGWLDGLVEPMSEPVAPAPVVSLPAFGPFEAVVTALVVAVMVFVLFYMFRHLPGSIVRGGRTLTHTPAEALAPVLLQRSRKRPSKKRQLQLTTRLVLVMKLVLVFLPVLLLVPVVFLSARPLELSVMWSVALFLATVSAICFAGEWVIARVFGVSPEKMD